ncbi:MAG: diacylglycerol kinase family protein [Spirochaetia bacterium]|nr:diacylglycerol kinase family protein [Spirochaetia bacterium]
MLRISHADWMYLTITITLVLFAELVNTAIESYVDLATKEMEDRVAKDVAAGAVFVTCGPRCACRFYLSSC